MNNRSAGILCPLFSLPGIYGIGQMGQSTYDFIDYLSHSGFSYWQILPLHPIDSDNSPYSSSSAFAGYPYFIDLTELVNEGLLKSEELPLEVKMNRVNYKLTENIINPVFEVLFKKFSTRANQKIKKELEKFEKEHHFWLHAFSIFSSLKKHFDGLCWNEWPSPYKYFKKLEAKHLNEFSDEIKYQKLLQFLFFRQWNAIKEYANQKGISIIGDMPIYVSYDSADVWSHTELFKLDRKLQKKEVAGVPPDFFSEDGQLWGFPIYNWRNHKKTKFQWWVERTSHLLKINDYLRFDHFRAVESFWSVSAEEDTAKNGKWVKAPGDELLHKLSKIKKDALIAENLGDISEEVEKLRRKYKIPGMKIFQFAFGGHIHSEHLPHNCDVNDIYYSGTHDNNVLGNWLKTASSDTISHLTSYYGTKSEFLSTRWLLDRILSSSPKVVILPIQDFLELGEGSRINIPGTTSELNWTWRLKEEDLHINKPGDTQYRLDFFGRKQKD